MGSGWGGGAERRVGGLWGARSAPHPEGDSLEYIPFNAVQNCQVDLGPTSVKRIFVVSVVIHFGVQNNQSQQNVANVGVINESGVGRT